MMYSYKIPALLTCLVLLHACGSMPMPGKSSLAVSKQQNDRLTYTPDNVTPLQNLKMPVVSRAIGSSSSVDIADIPKRPHSKNSQDNIYAPVSSQIAIPQTGKKLDKVLVENGVVNPSTTRTTEKADLEQVQILVEPTKTRELTTVITETGKNEKQEKSLQVEQKKNDANSVSLGAADKVSIAKVSIPKVSVADRATIKPANNARGNTQLTMLNKPQGSTAQVPPPNVDDIKFNLAQRYFRSGKYQNSIDIMESMGKTGLQKDKMRDLLVMSYTKYARKLEKKAELLEAQTILEKALGMEPNNKLIIEQLTGVKNIRESNRLYEIALESYNAGKRDVAFKSFRHILSLNPNHATAKKYYDRLKLSVVDGFHKKALQFYRHQQLSQAIEEWDQLLEVDPANDLAKLYRSRAVELKRKFERL